ncbi:peptidoglycan-binding protein [Streptomyces sp. AJS327]|nr:peptidoglycan-binding protein [Streptomyces sp. AJS327]
MVLALTAALASVAVGLGLAQPAAAADWPALSNGSSGANITSAQYLLAAHGHGIDADGQFGPATEGAVRAFQQAKGYGVDGVIGSETWPGLIVTVKEGDKGHAVSAAQTALNKHGAGLSVDGQFGPATAKAARAFQDKQGLTTDGVVGPQTWQQLIAEGGGDDGGGGDCYIPDPDPEVIRVVYRVATDLGVDDRVLLAGFEAGVVESNMNNLDCGDRDSLGVFQQRPSQGWGTPEQIMDVSFASNSFFTRAIEEAAADPDASAGTVAQRVQVSAFPERYDQVEGTARKLIEQAKAMD